MRSYSEVNKLVILYLDHNIKLKLFCIGNFNLDQILNLKLSFRSNFVSEVFIWIMIREHVHLGEVLKELRKTARWALGSLGTSKRPISTCHLAPIENGKWKRPLSHRFCWKRNNRRPVRYSTCVIPRVLTVFSNRTAVYQPRDLQQFRRMWIRLPAL